MLALLLAALLLSAHAVAMEDFVLKRQTSRKAILERQFRGIIRRDSSSPSACASGIRDGSNACCVASLDPYTHLCCPATAPIYADPCCATDKVFSCLGAPACCSGQVYGRVNGQGGKCCSSSSTVYTLSGGVQACCSSSQTPYLDSGNNPQCCSTALQNGVCPGTTTPGRHNHVSDWTATTLDRSPMSRFSPERILLNSELTAEYLLNNGVFSFDGMTFADPEQQKRSQGAWSRALAKGVNKLMPYVLPRMKATFADAYGKIKVVPLSEAYEFHIDDVPDVWARIAAQSDFSHLEWSGLSFDRDTLYALAAPHPYFNSSLVNLYR